MTVASYCQNFHIKLFLTSKQEKLVKNCKRRFKKANQMFSKIAIELFIK